MRQNEFIANFQKFMQNRSGYMPPGVTDPGQAIQQLMDSGKITQAQYNQARMMAQSLYSNPAVRQLLK